MQQEVVIHVDNISKDFHYTGNKAGTIKSLVTGVFRSEHDKNADIQHALKDVSFEIKKGEFFGIVGRNGSGKSTLLKILAQIYQPNKGSVKTKGKLVPFIELGVGFNPELTGRENIYLNGALLGFSKKEIDNQFDSIVEFAELEKFMEQKLKNYSSGMQVRLAFSMAVRAQADILLIDEVLAVGDSDFQRKCFDYFRELKRKKTTVVFVSHDMNAVREYCDRTVLIEKSRVLTIGNPEQVAKQYTKLFMHEEKDKSQVTGEQTKRVGTQQVSVEIVKTDKTTYRAGQDRDVQIKMEIVAKQDISSNLSIGFLIKNAANASVLGMNTQELRKKIGTIKKGERLVIEWAVPNVFGDGKYTIDGAITSSDGTINYDWWEDATGFKAYREEYSPYIITPDIGVKISRP